MLALGQAKEAAKETRFFCLQVHLQILVIIHLRGSQLSLFGFGRCKLVGIQAVRDDAMALKME